MAKLEIIALGGVVYKVKSTGPSTEPCGPPYESVTLSDSVLRRKPNFPTRSDMEVYILM